VASVDAQKVVRFVWPEKYGMHRLATFGDWRARLHDLAVLLGFRLIQEDR